MKLLLKHKKDDEDGILLLDKIVARGNGSGMIDGSLSKGMTNSLHFNALRLLFTFSK